MLHSLGKNFTLRNDGNVAVFIVLLSLPILTVVGLAAEESRQQTAADQLEFAIESAARAGTDALQNVINSDAMVQTIVERTYEDSLIIAQDTLTCQSPTILIDREADQVQVSGRCVLN